MTPEQVKELVERLTAAYEKVAVYPEYRMRPGAVQELGEGFMDLLALRNIAPKAASALSLLAQEREELREAAENASRVLRTYRPLGDDDEFAKMCHEAVQKIRAALKDT